MKRKHVMLLQLVGVMLFTSGCSNNPKPINYGFDACSFCMMTVVDKQHAAQLVTKKGKSYSYDAIECMMNDLKDWKHPEVTYFLVADFQNPGVLTNAKKASYLISQSIPSPMGKFLSAFESESERDEVKLKMTGHALDWSALKSEFDFQ